MYVFLTFPYSFDVELAVSELQKYGYQTDSLLAVPLQPFHRSGSMLDMMSEESSQMFDIALVSATAFMLLGVVYGYVLAWGPVIWGLIGIVFGGLLGVAIQAVINKVRKQKWKKPMKRQILLMVNVENKDEVKKIEEIMKPYQPTGYATMDLQDKLCSYLPG